jgi:hypothetical protein
MIVYNATKKEFNKHDVVEDMMNEIVDYITKLSN